MNKKNIYPVEYVVKVYDDLEKKIVVRHGLTFAQSFLEATKKIEAYYGKDLEDMRICLLEENDLYEFEINQDKNFHGILKIENVSLWDEE